MILPFTKMHGLGNDLVVVDLVTNDLAANNVELSVEQIRMMGDRHLGIGFDQLLLIEPPSDPGVDFDYRIYNCDGTEVEHCGNGARCFATFVTDKGLTRRNPIRVKTVNRVLSLEIKDDGQVMVDMAPPEFRPEKIPFKAEKQAKTYCRAIQLN